MNEDRLVNGQASRSVRAYAPASIGNFAAGFDLLGAALAPLDGSCLGDIVHITPAAKDTFRIEGAYAPILSLETKQNLVLRVYELFKEQLQSKDLVCGPFDFVLEKRLPLNSGLGSSASSIVATLAGLQAICGEPLSRTELLELASRAEATYSGGTPLDNVAPALLGGLQMRVPGEAGGASFRLLPWPEDLLLIVVHPDFELPTATSRAALPKELPWTEAISFAENLAAFAHALHTKDRRLLTRCLRDPLAEPHRADLVPGFRRAKVQALEAGALGCSLSGSGPSIFAVADSEEAATQVAEAIQSVLHGAGLDSQYWICGLDVEGARILN